VKGLGAKNDTANNNKQKMYWGILPKSVKSVGEDAA
jgi:hypothetical protein